MRFSAPKVPILLGDPEINKNLLLVNDNLSTGGGYGKPHWSNLVVYLDDFGLRMLLEYWEKQRSGCTQTMWMYEFEYRLLRLHVVRVDSLPINIIICYLCLLTKQRPLEISISTILLNTGYFSIFCGSPKKIGSFGAENFIFGCFTTFEISKIFSSEM